MPRRQTDPDAAIDTTTSLTLDYVEKRAKFKRRAEGNLNRAMNNYKQLARCANRSLYAYDDQQVDKLMVELKQGVADVERAFRDAGGEGRRWVEL